MAQTSGLTVSGKVTGSDGIPFASPVQAGAFACPAAEAVAPDCLGVTKAPANPLGDYALVVTPTSFPASYHVAGFADNGTVHLSPSVLVTFASASDGFTEDFVVPLSAPPPGSAPSVPLNVHATPGNWRQTTVSWDRPATGSDPVSTLYTATSSPGNFRCTAQGSTSCVVTLGGSFASYTFTVVATNSVGDSPRSAPSNPVVPLIVRTFTGARLGLSTPVAVATTQNRVWVVNAATSSVSVLSQSTGALIETVRGSASHFSRPRAIFSNGVHVWVANAGDNSVVDLSAATGKVVRVLKGARYALHDPEVLAGTDFGRFGGLFVVASRASNSVTVVDQGSDRVTRVLSGAAIGLGRGGALAVANTPQYGPVLFVANPLRNSVSAVSLTSGRVLSTMSGSRYGFRSPDGLAALDLANGNWELFVANAGARSVTQIDVSTFRVSSVLGGEGSLLSRPGSLAVTQARSGPSFLFVGDVDGGPLVEIEVGSPKVVGTLDTGPVSCVAQGGDAWLVEGAKNAVVEVSP